MIVRKKYSNNQEVMIEIYVLKPPENLKAIKNQ